MIDGQSREDRLKFQKLCAECQRLQSELRQSAADPVSLERSWLSVWNDITTATTSEARLAAVREHREALKIQVRHMSETRWQIITKINNRKDRKW